MAHHDYLGLEGGGKMVEFVVRMCALQDDEVSGSGIRTKIHIGMQQLPV